MRSTTSSPIISSTTVFHRKRIFGLSNARCCMIAEARSSSRRWTTSTSDANFVM